MPCGRKRHLVKLVIDNNVVISGMLWRGNPSTLLRTAFAGSAETYSSPALYAELRSVLSRQKFSGIIRSAETTVDEIMATVMQSCVTVPNSALSMPDNLRDPKDLMVLACAVTAGADVIVSGDDDLLSLVSFDGIPILTVVETLKKLGMN